MASTKSATRIISNTLFASIPRPSYLSLRLPRSPRPSPIHIPWLSVARSISYVDRLRSNDLEIYAQTNPSTKMSPSKSPVVYTSKYAEKPLPHTSIFHHHFPANNAQNFSDDLEAFIDPATEFVLTRGALRNGALRLGLGLERSSLGLRKGDVVLLFSPNVVEYPVVFFGGQAAGLVTSLANSNYTAPELAHQIHDCGAKVLFVAPALVPVVKDALKVLEAKHHVKGVKVFLLARDASLKGKSLEGLQSYETLMASESQVKQAKYNGTKFENGDEHKTALLCYSSGTTGLSKGVETTHFNITSLEIIVQEPYVQLSPHKGDKSIGVLPFYHIYGLVKVLLYSVYTGVPVVTHSKFEPEAFLSSIQKYKATWALVVPPIIVIMANHPIVEKYDISSLKGVISGAAPLGDGLVKKVTQRLPGLRVSQGYGLTETSPTTHVLPLEQGKDHMGSIGLLLPHLTARIIDIDGNDVPQGQPGELLFKGPTIMKGYWKNPKSTEDTFLDGWYRTGDIAQIDKDGYYFIVDRLKELIKYKGFQVPPADLEALLLTHPKVADAGVCAIYNEDQQTELPRAYVVPQGGMQSLKDEKAYKEFTTEVAEWVAKQVANHKKLRGGVIAIETIPKSAAGKILRRELRVMAQKEQEEAKKKAGRQAKL